MSSSYYRRCQKLLLMLAFVASAQGWSAFSCRRSFLIAAGSGGVALLVPNNSIGQARNLPESTPTDLSKTASLETLIPILRLQGAIQQLEQLIISSTNNNRNNNIEEIQRLISQIPTEELAFKALFDAYSDPVSYKQKFLDQNAFLVYYTKGFDGPGRPSIEEDVPIKQSIQYGRRNEAWIGWSDFTFEWKFQQEHPDQSSNQELIVPLGTTLTAINAYLSQASSTQVKEGLETLKR